MRLFGTSFGRLRGVADSHKYKSDALPACLAFSLPKTGSHQADQTVLAIMMAAPEVRS